MDDCIFCKIVEGSIPSYKIYEDKQVLVFLNIRPASPGHSLVIPKKHYDSLWELPDELYQQVHQVAKRLSDPLLKTSGAKRMGSALEGFEVPHAHYHLIPLTKGLMATLNDAPDEPVDSKVLEEFSNKFTSI